MEAVLNYEDCCLLGYDAVFSGASIAKFKGYAAYTVRKAIGFSETSILSASLHSIPS
jgi:hypothetical protein